jgi:hypothetical protein
MAEKSLDENARETVRVNLEVEPEVRDNIKALRKKSKAASLAEVFKRALALYEMVLDHNSAGGKIVFEDRDGNREVLKLL